MKGMKRSILAVGMFFAVASCGPVVLTSHPGPPPPHWFYPNRLELVRYVYFPEVHLYYDFTDHLYLYPESGVWIRVRTLPAAYRSFSPERSRYVRVRDYFDDDIGRYDRENNRSGGRSNLNTPPGRRNE